MTPEQTYLHEAFEISSKSESGLLWRNRPRHHFVRTNNWTAFNKRFAGKRAGTITKASPHWQVDLRSNQFRRENCPRNGCHEIIYILIHGSIPSGKVVDHINGNGLDNRPENLRLASFSQNVINTPRRKNCKYPKGVYKNGNKWAARISLDNIREYLGSFPSPEEAHEAYKQASARLHKEFSRVE